MIRFGLIVLIGIVAVGGALWSAQVPPYLGFEFQGRATVGSDAGQMTLDSLDLVKEPGELNNYSDLNRFYERQGQIFRIISAPSVQVSDDEAEGILYPRALRISDLPKLFWIQVFVGVSVFLISGGVWSVRARDLPSSLLLTGGFFILMAALSSAVYTTRELALPKSLFQILAFLNAFGGGLFGSVILTLFLVHPFRVPFWKQLASIQTVVFGIWVGLYLSQMAWANVNLSLVTQMILVCLAVGYQLWLSRDNSEARFSLTWLGMSMIFGGGAFIVFNTVPVLLQIPALDQGYSFVFILFIYLGVAAGLTQFQVFKWARWMFYFCFYSFGLTAFALLYAGFVSVFRLETWPAIGMASMVILFLYVPLGESFWRSLRKPDQS